MARLLIVDDHPVVREGLKTFLSLYPEFDAVAEAGSVAEALAAVQRQLPDLVLLDVKLPDGNGLSLLPRFAALTPPPKTVILSSFLDEDAVREALRFGAGYLLKHAGPSSLLDGIKAALRGELPLDPGAAKLLANTKENPLVALTPREREVLGLIAQGLSNKAIAARLGVTEKTVKTHVSHVLAKLGLRDRVRAALFAKEHGF